MRFVATKFLLHNMTNSDSTFISRVKTRDESWVYGYDPDKKSVTAMGEWESLQSMRPKKVRQFRKHNKTNVHHYLQH